MKLDPVREVLLAEASRERAQILAAADSRAAEVVAAAELRAREQVAAARRAGAEAASLAGSHVLAEARRTARAASLAARAKLFEELVAAARDEAERLRAEPRHEALVKHLAALATRQLGAEAEVVTAAEGGIRAAAGARSVDYSLPVLIDRTLARTSADVEELWS